MTNTRNTKSNQITINELGKMINNGFKESHKDLLAVESKIMRKFDEVDSRFNKVDSRLDGLENQIGKIRFK